VELVRVILVGGEGWAVHAVAYLEGEGENEWTGFVGSVADFD
jgi:hypothetical protein